MQTASTIFLIILGGVFAVVGFAILIDALDNSAGPEDASSWPPVFMGGIFAAVGVGVVGMGFRQRVLAQRQQESRVQYPAQPWQWNEEWRSGRIQFNAKWGAIGMWGFAILWNGIVGTASVLGGEQLLKDASEDPTTYLFLVFPLVGIGVLIAAIHTTLQWRRYGTSTLILRTIPVRLGGHLEATVQLPHDVRDASELKVRVSCVRTTRRGKNTTTNVLWSDERTYPAASLGVGPTGPTLSIRQDMPKEGEQSSVGPQNPSTDWKVEVSAEVAGVDFHADYTIPVFPT